MRSTRYSSLLIAGYVAFQLLYPIRGLVENKFDTWGEFTWNMYSQSYSCRARYRLVDESSSEQAVQYQQYFHLPDRLGHVLNREGLLAFHEFLCGQLAREGRRGRLMGTVECIKDVTERESFVEPDVDICAAPHYAVRTN